MEKFLSSRSIDSTWSRGLIRSIFEFFTKSICWNFWARTTWGGGRGGGGGAGVGGGSHFHNGRGAFWVFLRFLLVNNKKNFMFLAFSLFFAKVPDADSRMTAPGTSKTNGPCSGRNRYQMVLAVEETSTKWHNTNMVPISAAPRNTKPRGDENR